MNSSYSGWTLMTAAILSFGIAVPALAQSNSTPASTLMHSAGQSMKNAGSNTWAATKDTYHAAKNALRDTETTAKVKLALHRDPTTHPYDIDVTTTAGVVTLQGKIPSHDVEVRAEKLAMETKGVRRVRNGMVIISSVGSQGNLGHGYSSSNEPTKG
jgi:osmotically-inducible protein OsmY